MNMEYSVGNNEASETRSDAGHLALRINGHCNVFRDSAHALQKAQQNDEDRLLEVSESIIVWGMEGHAVLEPSCSLYAQSKKASQSYQAVHYPTQSQLCLSGHHRACNFPARPHSLACNGSSVSSKVPVCTDAL